MAKNRKVSDIATQRGTSVDDVLAHLKKAGIDVVDGEVSVDEEAIEKAYAAPSGSAAGGGQLAIQPGPRRGEKHRIVVQPRAHG